MTSGIRKRQQDLSKLVSLDDLPTVDEFGDQEDDVHEILKTMMDPASLPPVISPIGSPRKKQKVGSSRLRVEARKLKEVAHKSKDDRESLWYYFKSGIKFIEFCNALQEEGKDSEASDVFLSTASFFSFCIHRADKQQTTYLAALGYACKAWCNYQSFKLRKKEVYRNSSKASQIIDLSQNTIKAPNSAGSIGSSGTEGSPEMPPTPTSLLNRDVNSVSLSRSSFSSLKKFVQRDSKALVGFMSSLDGYIQNRPSDDFIREHGLCPPELETIVLGGKVSTIEFIQFIHREVDKGKEVVYSV